MFIAQLSVGEFGEVVEEVAKIKHKDRRRCRPHGEQTEVIGIGYRDVNILVYIKK